MKRLGMMDSWMNKRSNLKASLWALTNCDKIFFFHNVKKCVDISTQNNGVIMNDNYQWTNQ